MIKLPVKKILRWTAGIFFLILGTLGLFLPVLQGILFLCIGILLLSADVPLFRKWLYVLQKKLPVTKSPLQKTRRWLRQRKKRA